MYNSVIDNIISAINEIVVIKIGAGLDSELMLKLLIIPSISEGTVNIDTCCVNANTLS